MEPARRVDRKAGPGVSAAHLGVRNNHRRCAELANLVMSIVRGFPKLT
jgi:hypothetical protein